MSHEPATALNYAGGLARVPGPIGRFLLSPVGWPLHTATLLVALGAMCVWSGPAPYLWPAVYVVYGGAGLAVTWLLRLMSRSVAARHFGGRPRGPALPWLVLPAGLVLAAAAIRYDVPAAVAFRISRPVMERAARAALATPTRSPTPVSIGLYGKCVPRVVGTSVYFTVGGRGPWQEDYGYAYRPSGPRHFPLRPSHLNDDAYCRNIEGPWYEWCGGY